MTRRRPAGNPKERPARSAARCGYRWRPGEPEVNAWPSRERRWGSDPAAKGGEREAVNLCPFGPLPLRLAANARCWIPGSISKSLLPGAKYQSLSPAPGRGVSRKTMNRSWDARSQQPAVLPRSHPAHFSSVPTWKPHRQPRWKRPSRPSCLLPACQSLWTTSDDSDRSAQDNSFGKGGRGLDAVAGP